MRALNRQTAWNRGRVGRVAAGIGLVLAGLVTLGGCGLSEALTGDLASVRAQAVRTREAIAADREGLLEAASTLPAGTPARAQAEALAATRATQQAAFTEAIQRLEAAQASASGMGSGAASDGDLGGRLEGGAALLAPLMPPGAQLPLILGAGFAASIWRATRLKKSAASIAEGLEKAMAGDDGLREGMKRNAATIRSVQTPTAQRIVDEVKRTRPMVRLPV